MPAGRYTVRLVDKVRRSDEVVSYFFERPVNYEFEPGNWYRLTLKVAGERLAHDFSHADSPTEPHVELVTRLSHSLFKVALDVLAVGGEAELDGPFGSFALREDLPRIAFLTGGVGIAPVRSMLRFLADTGKSQAEGKQYVLVCENAIESDILYRDEISALESSLPGLRVVHVLADPEEAWTGATGLLSPNLLTTELHDPRSWTFYVCGSISTIRQATWALDELEVPEEQRVVEDFRGYS